MPSYIFSEHALEQLQRRNIPLFWVYRVLQKPEQIVSQGDSMIKIYQSKILQGDGKLALLRVIVSEKSMKPLVLTAYVTSKVEKYWRKV